MSLTMKQTVFTLFFLLSWLLLLLLGDSYIGYVLMGGISLFLLLFSSKLDWQQIKNYQWLAVLWLLSLLGIGLSLFFSINLPLSIYFTTKFIFIFLSFWFLLLVRTSFISNLQLIKLLLLISLVILIISVIFQFFPSLTNLLPGMNLLHATYGHNHLAALLLLTIPLSWWLASEHIKRGDSRLWWLMPLGFSLGLLFAFGRVAVVIGLVQFLIISKRLKENHFLKSNKFNFMLKMLTILFVLVLAINTFFSTVTLFRSDFSCPVPSLERQLCKSITAESRPDYWYWAIEIIKNNFWFGSGPGTFSLAAKQYHLNPDGGSAHAHNDFLEMLSELGLVGGGVTIFMLLSLLYLAGVNRKKESSWGLETAIFLGVIAIYVDVLFDFDWNFIGILSMTLLLLALTIKNVKKSSAKSSFLKFFKIFYFLSIFILILVAGLYLKTDNLIKNNQAQQAFHLFPYFHWHRKIYENDLSLNKEDKQKFHQLYAANSAIYSTWVLETEDEQQRQQIKEKWFEVDPWVAINQDLISFYLEQNNFSRVYFWLRAMEKLCAQSTENDLSLTEDQRTRFIESIFAKVDNLVFSKDYQSAQNLLSASSYLFRDRYWLMAQPGNLAVLQGDLDKAAQLYKQCLDQYNSKEDLVHNDCYLGLQSIEAGTPNKNRYFQVSQIIRGEAVWQDFK